MCGKRLFHTSEVQDFLVNTDEDADPQDWNPIFIHVWRLIKSDNK